MPGKIKPHERGYGDKFYTHAYVGDVHDFDKLKLSLSKHFCCDVDHVFLDDEPWDAYLAALGDALLRFHTLNPKGFFKFMLELELGEPFDRNKFAHVADECDVVIASSESEEQFNFDYLVYKPGLPPAKGQVETDPDPEGGDDVHNLTLR